MGYEILLIIPIILIVGLTIAKNCQKKGLKIMFISLTFIVLLIFTFAYPAPLGINFDSQKIYWRGGINRDEKEKTCNKINEALRQFIGIEFVK